MRRPLHMIVVIAFGGPNNPKQWAGGSDDGERVTVLRSVLQSKTYVRTELHEIADLKFSQVAAGT